MEGIDEIRMKSSAKESGGVDFNIVEDWGWGKDWWCKGFQHSKTHNLKNFCFTLLSYPPLAFHRAS